MRRVVSGVRRRLGRVRRWIPEQRRQRELRASPADEAALIAAVRAASPASTLERGPLVSIVILNRDGREHLERCLGPSRPRAYRDVEVIVVDNGSTDGSPDLAESFELPFPLRVIRNATNRTFSEANGQGVAIAAGQLVCFLNNDVDPITDDWLGYLVETMTSRGAVAVGARLIYPRHRGGARAGSNLRDLSLQHAGVAFDRSRGGPAGQGRRCRRRRSGAVGGPGPDRPALTAACLLVELDAFRAVGGFSSEYDYGTEDVDLCLKLRAAGGRLVYDGRAALWHHELATRTVDRAAYKARVAGNRNNFIDIWGPRIFRDALLDALRRWTKSSRAMPFHVAIIASGNVPETRTRGHDLGGGPRGIRLAGQLLRRAPTKSGRARIGRSRRSSSLDDACDLRRLPRKLVSVAWIDGDPDRWLDRPWFDDFDIVFASDDEVAARIRERSAKVAHVLPSGIGPALRARDGPAERGRDPPRAHRLGHCHTVSDCAIGVPTWEGIDRWGDYHFARGLPAVAGASRPSDAGPLPSRLEFIAGSAR